MCEDKPIVLVDGYAQIYRSFYAIRGLTAPDGRPSNALFGVARFALTLDEALSHTMGAVVLDKGKPEHRLALLPEYKATRPKMPDELRSQIEPVRRWLDAMGWPLLEQEGYEADDIIAGVVAARESHRVAIVSHDKDLSQLVQDGVDLVIPGKRKSFTVLDREGVVKKFGVPPEKMADYIALVGDSVDNIEGVGGVGPKTAASLLNEFDSISDMLQHLDAIERKSIRNKLAESSERLDRNLKLVRLHDVVPHDWKGLGDLERRPPDWDALLDMAADYGFTSLISDLKKRRDDDRNPTLF